MGNPTRIFLVTGARVFVDERKSIRSAFVQFVMHPLACGMIEDFFRDVGAVLPPYQIGREWPCYAAALRSPWITRPIRMYSNPKTTNANFTDALIPAI